MASNRHTPRLVRLAVVTSLAALTVSVLPGTSQATPAQPAASTPKTAADAATKVAQLADQLEALSEDVNGRSIEVKRLQGVFNKAKAAADAADKRYTKLSGEVAAIVRSTYISAPFGQFTTLMTSTSPEDFLNQLATLERMSSQRGKVIADVLRAKQSLDLARNAAKTAYGKALTEYQAKAKKQQQLTTQIAQYKTLFNKLTQQERAQLFARNGGTASRGGTRVNPGQLPPAPNPKAQIAINAALSKQGSAYVWGAAGENTFDCSGLMVWAWNKAGVSLPHQSGQQYGYGTHVTPDVSVLKPGDLLFFYSPIHHVAMYVGGGQMVHAPNSGDVVKVVGVDWANIVGATRL